MQHIKDCCFRANYRALCSIQAASALVWTYRIEVCGKGLKYFRAWDNSWRSVCLKGYVVTLLKEIMSDNYPAEIWLSPRKSVIFKQFSPCTGLLSMGAMQCHFLQGLTCQSLLLEALETVRILELFFALCISSLKKCDSRNAPWRWV